MPTNWNLLAMLPDCMRLDEESECQREGCSEAAVIACYGGCGEYVPVCEGHAWLWDDREYERATWEWKRRAEEYKRCTT
jgi:hypothetical protein